MEAGLDRWHRFDMGIPPASKGDWAFLLHMIASMSGNGRVAAVAPHGVLFRGAAEGRIRQTIIEKNLIDAVIGLPDKRLGEIAAAIVQIKEGVLMKPEELDEFCKALPRYKRPHKIIFAEVPRNPTGKIEKPKLREKYGADKLIADQNMG